MRTQTQPTTSSLAPFGARLATLRARDPYIDALAAACIELDDEIAECEDKIPTRYSVEVERMKRKRDNYLDTIGFLIADQTAHRHAA